MYSLKEEQNRYRIVHKIAKDAAKEEIKSRNMLLQDEHIPMVGKLREKRNFVKESYDKFMNQQETNKKNSKK